MNDVMMVGLRVMMIATQIAAAILGVTCFCPTAHAATVADFDSVGTPSVLEAHCSVTAPELLTDETSNGNFLRLAHADGVVPECNTLSFERSDLGLYSSVELAFDFRLGPVGGALADGFGITLLNSATTPPFGSVASEVPEEPDYPESLGIGIDIHDYDGLPELVEPNANHISVHFGAHVVSLAITQEQLVLASGEWIHAEIDIDMEGAQVSIELSQGQQAFSAVVDVPGLRPYEGRVHFGARSGGSAAHHDLDNIVVEFVGAPDPAIYGSTGDLISWESVPINLHVLPTGKVLFWDRGPWMADDGMAHCTDCDRTPRLWDPAQPEATPLELPLPSYDLFCSGHQFLPDGRLFIGGGHVQDSVGSHHATIFDPWTNTFTDVADMEFGRWYPSVVTLENGDIVIFAGEQTPNVIAQTPERYGAEDNAWTTLDGASPNDIHKYYPFAYLVGEAQILIAGPQPQASMLDATGLGELRALATSTYGVRDYGSSAMYLPRQVMIAGGSRNVDGEPPTASVELIDLNVTTPAFTAAAPMLTPRRHLTLTMLADGSVLASGGSSVMMFNDARGAVHVSEIWDPQSNVWQPVMGTRVRRMYHSIAALLPDARVLIAGGGHPGDGEHDDTQHPDGELFSPPYLFRGPRPVIESAPESIEYGDTFAVELQSPGVTGDIQVSWVRLSSVTHGFNQNQRFQFLAATLQDASTVTVTAPEAAGDAPPGHYMLFVLDDGVPSVARIVRIGERAAIDPPDGGPGNNVDAGSTSDDSSNDGDDAGSDASSDTDDSSSVASDSGTGSNDDDAGSSDDDAGSSDDDAGSSDSSDTGDNGSDAGSNDDDLSDEDTAESENSDTNESDTGNDSDATEEDTADDDAGGRAIEHDGGASGAAGNDDGCNCRLRSSRSSDLWPVLLLFAAVALRRRNARSSPARRSNP